MRPLHLGFLSLLAAGCHSPRPLECLFVVENGSRTARCTGTVTARHGAEILEGTERLDGDLTFLGAIEHDLSHVSSLREITGTLAFRGRGQRGPRHTTLRGLDRLERIGGSLQIEGADRLVSLEGLGALRAIGGDLSLSRVPSLAHLDDLASLETLGGDLSIVGHVTDGGEITDQRLASLEGLAALTTIGGSLELMFLPRLTSLAGLDQVTTIGHSLVIYGNERLESVGSLAGATLEVEALPPDCSQATADPPSVRVWNPRLTSLDGLEGVRRAAWLEVGGDLLQEIDALAGVEEVQTLYLDEHLSGPVVDHLRALERCPSGTDDDAR